MKPADHPTIDQIADLQEDLLPATETDEVRAHIEACDRCLETQAALRGVSDLLAREAAGPVTVPPPVAASIDAALTRAAAEQAAGIPSLAERRAEGSGRSTRGRVQRWVFGAAAVAAAVVVVGGVLSAIDENSSSEDAGSAGERGVVQEDGSGAGSDPEVAPSDALTEGGLIESPDPTDSPYRLQPEKVRADAQALATGSIATTPPRGDCALVAESVDEDLLVTQYAADSERSLLLVDEAQDSYRLVDCVTGELIAKGTL